MVSVISVATALPEYHADNASVKVAAKKWLKKTPDKYALFERFLSSSRTESRYFVMPPDEIILQQSQEKKAHLFEEHAPALAISALKKALDAVDLQPSAVDALIFSSCSCPLIPAADTYLVSTLGLRPDIVRIPTYQYGCAGGVAGLGLAHRLANSSKNIAVVSTELCSLVFQPTNVKPSALVGGALFGDGSAAALLANDSSGGSLKIIDHQSYLIPQSRHLMGYDIRDTGSHLRLDRELPGDLSNIFPEVLSPFLRKHSLTPSVVPLWLFHPGSAKIVNRLEELLNLKPHQARWSLEVLQSVGNLSSATILFVLERFMKSGAASRGDKVVIVGIGPGLTIELVLAEMN